METVKSTKKEKSNLRPFKSSLIKVVLFWYDHTSHVPIFQPVEFVGSKVPLQQIEGGGKIGKFKILC
jgi:hypothetical protein